MADSKQSNLEIKSFNSIPSHLHIWLLKCHFASRFRCCQHETWTSLSPNHMNFHQLKAELDSRDDEVHELQDRLERQVSQFAIKNCPLFFVRDVGTGGMGHHHERRWKYMLVYLSMSLIFEYRNGNRCKTQRHGWYKSVGHWPLQKHGKLADIC